MIDVIYICQDELDIAELFDFCKSLLTDQTSTRNMYIQKFGGSILNNSNDVLVIKKVVDSDFLAHNYSVYVFSAFYKITDKLFDIVYFLDKDLKQSLKIFRDIMDFHLKICEDLKLDDVFLKKLFEEFELKLIFFNTRIVSPKIKDYIISFGEILSSLIIFNYFKNFMDINYIDSCDVVKTDDNFGNANINFKLTKALVQETIKKDKFYICSGFIASTKDGEITTLGRNGSDYSAAIFGEVLGAEKVNIWKDVDGVFTADPKIVKNASKIDHISYKEMSELCYFGARVIYLNALYPLLRENIPIEIKNLYSNNKGTMISSKNSELSIVGISNMKATIISVSGFKKYQDKFNITNKIISTFLEEKIEIIGSFQFSSILSFTIIIQYTENEKILNVLRKINFDTSLKVNYEQNSSVIAVIGESMLETPGVLGKIFNALSSKRISVNSCVTGFDDINICFSVEDKDKNEALNVIHSSVFD